MGFRSALLIGSAALCFSAAGIESALLPAAAQTAPEERTAINVYRLSSPSVVTVEIGRSGRGNGSGSIVSADGLVLTNDHVVRNAMGGQVSILTANGKRYPGRVIARDQSNDLALVQLTTSDRLPALRLGNASELAVGQRVFAIGSPFGLSGTLTTGILSRITPEGMLQTDAAINPGNSGGPLLNSKGELIGVNTAILSPGGQRPGNIGIGFASSVTAARRFIQLGMANRNTNTPLITGTRPGSAPNSRSPYNRPGEDDNLKPPSAMLPSNPRLPREPEGGFPDRRLPDSRFPEERSPEARIPDSRIPDSRIPDSRYPEGRSPDSRLPERRSPFRDNGRTLGVTLDSDFVIQMVDANSIAAAIGLRPGDQLIAVNGREISSSDQITTALNSAPQILLTVARNRRVANLLIRL
jgi:S1-C subfamily serine protease